MATVVTEFDDLVAAWPAPAQLSHMPGDLFLTLKYSSEYIEARWTGHITSEDVIRAGRLYLELLRKTPVAKLINDKFDVSGDWDEAIDWLEFEWFPKAYESGLRCLAHVYSTDMFSKLSARNMYQRLAPNFFIENFNDRASAEAWLRTCTPASVS
ncbi:hypothetical protein ACXYMU_15675 [Pontibacter sp. CAU 1760]